MRDPAAIFRGTPPRATKSKPEASSPYTTTSTYITEISSLRSRLRELEDDTRSSVVGFSDDDNCLSPNAIKKDIAKLEQEKATLEKDFLNQMSSLASENQNRIVDLQAMLAASESRNLDLQEQLAIRDKGQGSEKEQLIRIIEEQRESHTKEIEQMKHNLESTDMEITESRGEIDHLHEQLEELQHHRETLIEEVTSCRMTLTEEQRKLTTMKTELSSTKLTVEKLQAEIKIKDDKIKQKDYDLEKLTKGVGELKGAKRDFAESSKKTEILENEIREKDDLLKQQRDEISEINQEIIDIQDHKEMLMIEVTDLRMELQKREKSSANDLQAASSGSEHIKLLSENTKLGNEVKRMLERATANQKKIVEKETQIRNLSTSLIEERKTNSKLKAQLGTMDAASTKSLESSSTRNEIRSKEEIASLRNENNKLEKELQLLKQQEERRESLFPSVNPPTTGSTLRSFDQRSTKIPAPVFGIKNSSFSTNRDSDDLSVISRGQSSPKREGPGNRLFVSIPHSTQESRQPTNTPRTPVSGLVASFEKRIASRNIHDETLPFDASVELADELEHEKAVAKDLEKRLTQEIELVASLKAKLSDGIGDSTTAASQISAELVTKLERSEREILKLQTKVGELEELRKKHVDELDALRSEIVYNDVDREDLEKKSKEFENEIKSLHSDIERLNQQYQFEEENKRKETAIEIQNLEDQIKIKDDELKELHQKMRSDVEANDEKYFRLRTELLKKEEECNNMADAFKELQDIQALIVERDQKIAILEEEFSVLVKQTSSAALEKQNEIQILGDELRAMREKNKDIEVEYTTSIKDLEDKIGNLDLKLEELTTENVSLKTSIDAAEYRINNEISTSMRQLIDDERDSLTLELSTTQMNYAELEMKHSIKVKELEERIRGLEGKLAMEAEEKDMAKASLDDVVKKSELEASPQVKRVHDTEINRITVELTKTQIKQADLEREYSGKIKDLEMEIEELEVEAEAELKQKDKQIAELKQALEMKEDIVRRLEGERGHLCASMNDMSYSRNDEVHELQAEIIDLSTRTKAQEREVQSLKMKIQEYESSADNVSTKYEQKIKDLEEEINDLRIRGKGLIDPDTVATVKSENAKLRECVRDLKMERRSLNERLEVLMSERNGSKSTQILQKRNQALKDEVEKLTKRLKKLEASITRFAI